MLSKVGLKPSDIDIIIVSHPHFDHIDGMEFYKSTNAIVYIQRDSYRFMVEEGPESSIIRKDGLFPRKKDAALLVDLAWDGRLKILDGDSEIVPGIKTIKVGGHFPGLQITVVQTGAKPVILASDSVHQYDNLEKNIGMGIFQGNFKDMTKAYDTIRQLNGVVVAGHDKQVERAVQTDSGSRYTDLPVLRCRAFYKDEIPRFARSDDKPLPVIARRSRGNPIWILIKGRKIHKKEEKQNG